METFPQTLAWMDVGDDKYFETAREVLFGPIPSTLSGTPVGSDTKYFPHGSSIKPAKDSSEYSCLQGNLHYGKGEFMAAVDAYTHALEVSSASFAAEASPKNSALHALIYANRSAAHFALGLAKFAKLALEDAVAAIRIFAGWPRGYYRKGVAERGLALYASARKSLDEGHKLAIATQQEEASFVPSGGLKSMAQDFVAAMEELEKTIAYEGSSDADISKVDTLTSSETSNSAVDAAHSDRFDALEAWLLSRGTSSFPLLYMRKYSETNRGVHARCEISSECAVLTIGREFLITVEMGRACPVGRKLAAAGIDRELSAAKHCYLALFVLEDRKNPASFFQPYYGILPETYPNMPIFWSDSELYFLQGSYLLQQIADRKENLTVDYELICKSVPEVRSICTLEEFWWARMMVASRNFGILVDNMRTDALVPYADMLNHYRPRQTRWAFENRKQAFVIHSLVKLYPGQQVYDSYGKKCNSRFLLNYGFTVDHNQDDDTGQNHNEVRLLLEMLGPDEDPWYTHKQRLLGDVSIRDDTSVAYGHPSVREVPRGRALQQRRSVRVSTYYENEGNVEAFAFLRFAHAKDHDMVYLPRMDTDYDFTRRPIAPLSVANELAVLAVLAEECKEQLSRYPSTLQQDIEELKSARWPYGSNKRNALVLLKGEKEVCHYYIQLHEVCKEIAALSWADFNAQIGDRFADSSDLSKYVRTVFGRLMRKRHEEMSVEGLSAAELEARLGVFSLSDLASRYGLR